MSASVRIDSGIAAGTSYWIDRPVLRIGSDPQCEICVPSADLAPHAVTLEFRGGTYRAYNRSSAPINLGRTLLQPGSSGTWEDGSALALPGGMQLTLAFDGDPRPSPRPDARFADGIDEPEVAIDGTASGAATAEAAQKAKSKSMLQMLIILVCVLATGGLLYLNNTGGFDTAPPANRPNFNSIVESSLKKGPNIRSIVERLQYAQSFVVRGNLEQARLRYAELRDQLVSQIDTMPADEKKDAEVIRDFVEMQLGQLQ